MQTKTSALVQPRDFDDIGKLLEAQAGDGSHPAILFGETTISYGELMESVRRVSALLADVPVSHGDRVVILAGNSPAYLVNNLAVVHRGAAFVPIHVELSVPEISYILEHASPALILCDPALQDKLRSAQGGKFEVPIRSPEWFLDCKDPSAVEGTSPVRERMPDDDVLICYTSGTTASPKGVTASHRVEIASASGFGAMWKIGRDDIATVALPLSSLFGLHTASFVPLAHGATILLLPRFHPVHVLEAIEARRSTILYGVPTMYAMMLEHVRQTGKRYDLSSIRLAVVSGAAVPSTLKEGFKAYFGIELLEYYALSEVRPVFSPDLRKGAAVPPGSAGYLAPDTQARILDDEGREVPDGEVGALFLRASSMMKSYFHDPVRTAAAFRDGWFETGDLVRKEGDFYFLVGRTRDQIISGGSKIAAAEVENALLKHPDVKEAAVIGIPDDVRGQLVKAVLVLRPGAKVSTEQLAVHCAEHLAAYKVPSTFAFVDGLPIGPTGKVLKRALS
ncbi:hypothetical protein D8I24_3256 (plasmid) [Cupriavidus necator H850]|uniref:class I adenylate-forming enzyme family protein n=1 Tax=Cupriavidus necator TaxID=106590 RepID=UPI00129D759E|nr:AMP-binding protein [Cupriavidus necator]KAI3602705.1 hypothetical protein D8I24_3256 [Cupriavidus necator H850]